jgi:hypothetical protein
MAKDATARSMLEEGYKAGLTGWRIYETKIRASPTT